MNAPVADRRDRLLLVEDDPDLGPLLCEALEDDYDVMLATSLAGGAAETARAEFDVLVIDRRLPDGDGIDLVASLRRTGVATPVLVLTALGTVRDRVDGLDAGANDYLVKPFDLDELLARLRAICRVFGTDGSPTRIGDWDFFPRSRAIHSPYVGRIILSERECQVLELLASDPSRTFSRREILHRVFDAGDSLGVVDTYVHYIRRKTVPEIVTTVRGRGYRLGLT
ncbi:response regulator transcription factor [Propionicicella superfundia]|uniref:response regulator transcription factor n=1 Tax=Propionicicella superfundia TaxID=348582 RepID=UPI0004298410|nr:response regulator transcription factor [Propionicicella superfundia]